jgi:hypothetical protein
VDSGVGSGVGSGEGSGVGSGVGSGGGNVSSHAIVTFLRIGDKVKSVVERVA